MGFYLVTIAVSVQPICGLDLSPIKHCVDGVFRFLRSAQSDYRISRSKIP